MTLWHLFPQSLSNGPFFYSFCYKFLTHRVHAFFIWQLNLHAKYHLLLLTGAIIFTTTIITYQQPCRQNHVMPPLVNPSYNPYSSVWWFLHPLLFLKSNLNDGQNHNGLLSQPPSPPSTTSSCTSFHFLHCSLIPTMCFPALPLLRLFLSPHLHTFFTMPFPCITILQSQQCPHH